MSLTTSYFQRAVIIVTKTFGILYRKNYYCGIGEEFLLRRLEELCLTGKLVGRFSENGNRWDFEVRLTN
ncbi:MAG: hypothetical protein ACI35V_12975 [Sphingobacterium composti]